MEVPKGRQLVMRVISYNYWNQSPRFIGYVLSPHGQGVWKHICSLWPTFEANANIKLGNDMKIRSCLDT